MHFRLHFSTSLFDTAFDPSFELVDQPSRLLESLVHVSAKKVLSSRSDPGLLGQLLTDVGHRLGTGVKFCVEAPLDSAESRIERLPEVVECAEQGSFERLQPFVGLLQVIADEDPLQASKIIISEARRNRMYRIGSRTRDICGWASSVRRHRRYFWRGGVLPNYLIRVHLPNNRVISNLDSRPLPISRYLS